MIPRGPRPHGAVIRALALTAATSISPAPAAEVLLPDPYAPAPPAADILSAEQRFPSGVAVPQPVTRPDIAPQPERRGGWRVVPSMTVLETYTDNVGLTSNKESDLITSLSPGIRIDGDGARLKMHLDYRRNQLYYAGDSRRNSSQNFLNAGGTLEAVERLLFIDAGASITQQALSAFGSQPTVTENSNTNRVETSAYYVSPYAKGRLGLVADYELRYKLTTTSSRGGALPDSESNNWTGVLKSLTSGTAFDWILDASRETVNYETRSSLALSKLRASLIYHLDQELQTSLILGQESNNYYSANTEHKTTYGAGFEWVPSPRTRVSGTREQKFFGESHAFSVTHRTPLSSWEFLDSRSVSVLPNQLSVAHNGTAFDLLFNALATRFPDPLLRAQAVDQLLLQNGIPSNLGVQTGFLTTRAFVERRRQASFALLGARNTITFTAGVTRREAIGPGGGAGPDDFSLTPEISQRNLSANWAYKLSGVSSLNLLLSHIESTGTGATNLDTTQNTVRLMFSHQFSPRTTGTLSLRYMKFDSTASANYTEKAVTASVSTAF